VSVDFHWLLPFLFEQSQLALKAEICQPPCMTRSYAEICAALRYGVIVRRKAMERFHSEVVHLSTSPKDDDRFTVVPIEASGAMEAARRIAEIAARRRYGEQGFVGGVWTTENDDRFLASIGDYHLEGTNGVTVGVTIAIRVWPAGNPLA
jgi:hypothetical protein